MLKKAVVVMSLLLGACSSLDSESDFSQSVASVNNKGSQVNVIGKTYTPIADSSNGGDIVKSKAVVVLQSPSNSDAITGQVNMEVSYFKSYTEFEKATYLGKTVELTEVKPSTSTCTEHCTASQYFYFPIDQAAVNSADSGDFKFDLITNSNYKVTFTIAGGYMKALRDEVVSQKGSSAAVATVPVVAAVSSSPVEANAKSVEMIQYWYEKTPKSEQAQFVDWAVQHRKSGSSEPVFESQPAQMMQYWYNEASVEERQASLAWLLAL